MDSVLEAALRQDIMDWVAERAARNGGWVSRAELLEGFSVAGTPLPLIDHSRGIRNPKAMDATLSIVSSATGPYEDREIGDGLLHYAYRSGDPDGSDNRKLRRAKETGAPLILFLKTEPNVYVPVQPVYVVGEDRPGRSFVVALDEAFRFVHDPVHLSEDERRYALRIARQRLHQAVFRGRVIRAYDSRCAVCSLHHARLLDAAHITADVDEAGHAVVPNGLSLCKIHHSAYDQQLLGISGDYRIVIDRALLDEIDGPMLRYGLQDMHGRDILLPARRKDWPDRDRLARRFESFGVG